MQQKTAQNYLKSIHQSFLSQAAGTNQFLLIINVQLAFLQLQSTSKKYDGYE